MVPLLHKFRQRYSPLHIGYLWLIGLSGWILLIYELCTQEFSPLSSEKYGVLSAAVLVAILCRVLTFNVYDHVKIAIDTAYYMSVAFIIGPIVAAAIAAFALFFDTIFRFVWRRFYSDEEPLKLSYLSGQTVFNGGVPVIAAVLVNAIVGTDITGLDDWHIAFKFSLFTTLFLLIHYAIASIASLVQGRTLKGVFTHFYIGVVGYELAMIPLGAGLLLGYVHQGVWFFITLTVAYLICNYLCRRLADQNILSRQRASQLATLNDVGQYISAKLQMDELIAIVAEYSQNLVRRTPSKFIFGLLNEHDHTLVDYTLFSESNGQISSQYQVELGGDFPAVVINNKQPLLLKDLPNEAKNYNISVEKADFRFHSWLGVPLLAHEEVLGIIILQTEQRGAYDAGTMTAFSTIARQTAIAVQNAKLYQLATKDGLSKLYVRRYFDQRISDEWYRSRHNDTPLSLLMMDLDNFKSFNDNYGHQAGDIVIKKSAELVIRGLRSDDVVARYGGEEFAFILPHTPLKAAMGVADRIVKRIAAERIEYDGNVFSITASIGVASTPENAPKDCAELISMADQALYAAKEAGKNCSRVFVKGVESPPEQSAEVSHASVAGEN